jgi:hypothetical protein
MAHGLLSHGQDVDGLVPQYPREAGLGAHGTPRAASTDIHHDRPARHSPTAAKGKPHPGRDLRLSPRPSLPITKPANLRKVTHYIYRALLAPLLNPSMSPIHPIILLGAWVFNLLNAVSLGGHLAGFGPTLTTRLTLGLPIWALGFAGTITHDEILRRGRRAASKPGAPVKAENTHTVPDSHGGKKTYVLASGGLFRWVLSPHYLCEWIEWVGFYIATGGALPARNFVAAEVSTMLPRAIATRKWYVERFPVVEGRWAALPGLV